MGRIWGSGVIRGMMAAACSRRAPSGGGAAAGSYNFIDGTIPSALAPAAAAEWYVVTEPYPDPGYAKSLRAKATANGASTQFTLLVESNGATNGFKIRHRVSSEANYDFFTVTIDGVEVIKRSGGVVTYAEYVATLSAGTHTVVFKYAKDASATANSDTVFISLIEWT